MTMTAPTRQTSGGRASGGYTASPRGTNEANVSTEQSKTQADTRLPSTHGYRGGSPGLEAAARQGTQTANRQHSPEATLLTTHAADRRLPKSRRVRKRVEYVKLQQVGRRRAGVRFVVITAPRHAGGSRLGITASRRVGGAVVRNRVKRLVREFFRQYQHALRAAQDVLVIARPDAATATYDEVRRELATALRINAHE